MASNLTFDSNTHVSQGIDCPERAHVGGGHHLWQLFDSLPHFSFGQHRSVVLKSDWPKMPGRRVLSARVATSIIC